MGKWELTMNPVQEWGEELEDGVVYGVTLRREPLPSSPASEKNPCCPFVQYRTYKVRRLKAASLDGLVAHLLDSARQEADFGRILLSSYRTFTDAAHLVELLFLRDNAASGLDSSECIRSHLLTFVQTWLDEYSEDFRDPPLHAPLRLLLDHLKISSAVHDTVRSQPTFCSLAAQAEELLRTFLQDGKTNTCPDQVDVKQVFHEDNTGCETSLVQEGIMDFPEVEIAEQLTHLDSALFAKVVPYQCLGCVWSQRDKKEDISPTVRATVAQFNAVANQVIVSLLCQHRAQATASLTSACWAFSTPDQRARVIEKWIRVAQGDPVSSSVQLSPQAPEDLACGQQVRMGNRTTSSPVSTLAFICYTHSDEMRSFPDGAFIKLFFTRLEEQLSNYLPSC